MMYYILASTYGSGNYNSSTYNGASGGGLSDTGFNIALIVTFACVLLLVAMIVRIWRRPSRKAAAEAETESKKQTQGYGSGGF